MIDVTPEVILQMVASREDLRTDDAVSRFIIFKNFRMHLPDVAHTRAEPLALGEADVAAEHGLGAPVFLRGVAAWRCFEPEGK